MNEMLEQLKIDPEFEKVIQPLTKDEYHQLEENIIDDGRIMSLSLCGVTSLWMDITAIVLPVSMGIFRYQPHSLTLPIVTRRLLGYAKTNLVGAI